MLTTTSEHRITFGEPVGKASCIRERIRDKGLVRTDVQKPQTALIPVGTHNLNPQSTQVHADECSPDISEHTVVSHFLPFASPIENIAGNSLAIQLSGVCTGFLYIPRSLGDSGNWLSKGFADICKQKGAGSVTQNH